LGKFKDRKSRKRINGDLIGGIIELGLGAVAFIMLFFNNFLSRFLLGSFGLMAFPLVLLFSLLGLRRIVGIGFNVNPKIFSFVIVDIIIAIILLHTIFASQIIGGLTVRAGLKATYAQEFGVTVGGVVFGLIPTFIGAVMGWFGDVVIFAIALAILVGLTIDQIVYKKKSNDVFASKPRRVRSISNASEIEADENNNINAVAEESVSLEQDNSDIISESDESNAEKEPEERQNAKSILFDAQYSKPNQNKSSEPKTAREILFGDKNMPNNLSSSNEERRAWLDASANTNSPFTSDDEIEDDFSSPRSNLRQNAREMLFGLKPQNPISDPDNSNESDATSNSNDYRSNDDDDDEISSRMGRAGRANFDRRFNSDVYNDYEEEDSNLAINSDRLRQGRDRIRAFNDDNNYDFDNNNLNRPARFETDLTLEDHGDTPDRLTRTPPRMLDASDRIPSDRFNNSNSYSDLTNSQESRFNRLNQSDENRIQRFEQAQMGQVAKPDKPIKPVVKDVRYNPPPTSLLKESKDDPSKYAKNYEENSRIIEAKLDEFKIPAKVVGVVRGPSVTRYELSMPAGIPVKKILAYDSDLAMALRTKQGIRIEAPIPGKNAVGIETPNDPRSMVTLRELVESKEFQSSTMSLPVAVGKSISGEVIVKNLAKMVHVLVAGSTGSGKSVFLHSVIMSLMFKLSPEQLRFIMIDPKRVEFSRYKGMPHMMLSDVVSDAAKAVNALQWAVKEMERRYKLLEENRCQGLEAFNQCEAVKNGELKKLPYLVIIVDELAELMSVAKKDVEYCIRRISQLGRASGIHLVLATQRPSVEVITGTIKANLPNRIAFSLTSFIDSKTILDEPGAEKLLGQGDMLFSAQESNTPVRLQGAFVGDDEIDRCVDFIKRNNETTYDEEVEREIYADKEEPADAQANAPKGELVDHSDQMDELLPAALKYFIENKKGSINMVQRRFYVGYSRAARIVDQMEIRGYVSQADGSKNREILLNMDDFRQIFGDDV